MNPDVDEYLRQARKWPAELAELRRILLDSPLSEDFKWRSPCYTFQGQNVIIIIGELKDYCTFSFFKGALLKDPYEILAKPGENSRATRLIPFTNVPRILTLEPILQEYIQEAIELEKAGLKIDFQQDREVAIPVEFQTKLASNPGLKAAFEALTPGRQRGYLLHFSGAAQSKTRTSRIEKSLPRILAGKGLNDCTCGLSRKLPACDGSHKRQQ